MTVLKRGAPFTATPVTHTADDNGTHTWDLRRTSDTPLVEAQPASTSATACRKEPAHRSATCCSAHAETFHTTYRDSGAYTLATVDSGPFRGYAYVRSVAFHIDQLGIINKVYSPNGTVPPYYGVGDL